MSKLKFRDIAQKVAEKESGKKQVNIAQISEVLKCTFQVLASKKPSETLELIERYEEAF